MTDSNNYMEKVNKFRTKLIILVSNELNKNPNKTKMRLNSQNLSDINDNFSTNSFEVFMNNPIEIGKPNHFGSRNYFNLNKKKENIPKKIPSFLNVLKFNNQNNENNEVSHNDILIVQKKNISHLKKSLGPHLPKRKKKEIKHSKKFLMKKGIKFLRNLSDHLKDVHKKLNKKNEQIKETSIHNYLRQDILKDPYLIGNPNYSPLIHYK